MPKTNRLNKGTVLQSFVLKVIAGVSIPLFIVNEIKGKLDNFGRQFCSGKAITIVPVFTPKTNQKKKTKQR